LKKENVPLTFQQWLHMANSMTPIRYAICSIERVGSGYLCELLRNNGLGRPSERFCSRQERSPEELHAWRAKVESEDSVNEVIGTKLFPGDWKKWENYYCATHLIRLRRQNCIEQAISLYLARRTHSWRSIIAPKIPTNSIDFDSTEILRCFEEIVEYNKYWDSVLAHRNHLLVIYERLCVNPLLHLERIFEFLERPVPLNIQLETKLKKQRIDAQVTEWSDRIRALVPGIDSGNMQCS